jgi:lipopolysaccharide transport system ATP-binding protein
MGTISVKDVGKKYKNYNSRWARLAEWFLPFIGTRHEKKWVLRDISFDVSEGEAVAICGVNGAGKSTLLKMITGTTSTSEGEISIVGNVAALLELGIGFHPDFTGRQNVYMAGQLLGLSTTEIDDLMPAIEGFAEIGEYIDHPVRTYSSGMQMRLAFSVATARRPEVLIVDEALSVGDAYFQTKSFDRIREYRDLGTTLLIVSHNRAAIQSICQRVILLDKGKLIKDGPPEDVMDYYHALLAKHEGTLIKQHQLSDGSFQTISGTGEVVVMSVGIYSQDEKELDIVSMGERVQLRIDAKVNVEVDLLVLGFMIKDQYGQPIYGINTERINHSLKDLVIDEKVSFTFDIDMHIGAGNYTIAVALSRRDSHTVKNYEWRDRAVLFSVVNTNHENFVGSAWLNVDANTYRNGEKSRGIMLGPQALL